MPNKKHRCENPPCSNDCLADILRTLKLPKLPKPSRKKKVKKEPPAKCGLCKRKLLPVEGSQHCMACQYLMDNGSR